MAVSSVFISLSLFLASTSCQIPHLDTSSFVNCLDFTKVSSWDFSRQKKNFFQGFKKTILFFKQVLQLEYSEFKHNEFNNKDVNFEQ